MITTTLMETIDTVIIGGGISGLSFAQCCQQHTIPAIVLEQTNTLGGCAETWIPATDLFIERGTHTLYRIYKNCYAALSEKARQTLYPNAAFKHFVNTDAKRCSFTSVLHWMDLWRTPRFFLHSRHNKSLGEFFTPIVGKRNMRDCLEPAFDALYCQPAYDYPAELLFKRRDRKTLRHLPKAFFLSGGMSALVANLSDGIDFRLNHSVDRITHEGDYYQVYRPSCEKPDFQCKHLVLAVPIHEAIRLLHSLNEPDIPQLPDVTPCTSLAFSVLYRTHKPETESGLIGYKQPFYSAIFARRGPTAQHDLDGVTFHFRQPDISDERALQIICGVLRISIDQVLQTQKKINRLPALRPPHLPIIRYLRQHSHPNIMLIGNYFDGFSMEDCLGRSHEAFNQWFDKPH